MHPIAKQAFLRRIAAQENPRGLLVNDLLHTEAGQKADSWFSRMLSSIPYVGERLAPPVEVPEEVVPVEEIPDMSEESQVVLDEATIPEVSDAIVEPPPIESTPKKEVEVTAVDKPFSEEKDKVVKDVKKAMLSEDGSVAPLYGGLETPENPRAKIRRDRQFASEPPRQDHGFSNLRHIF